MPTASPKVRRASARLAAVARLTRGLGLGGSSERPGRGGAFIYFTKAREDIYRWLPQMGYGKRKPMHGRPGKRQMLAAHAKHQTQRHMAFMKKRMREGASFTQAHKEAKHCLLYTSPSPRDRG